MASPQISRASTPSSESSNLSSPTFSLPPDTEESIRRRKQSDIASAELGKRLLKGWAMLAEECPNEQCYGVPLMRPPKSDGKDPRKECVVCGSTYTTEHDDRGREHLVLSPRPTASIMSAATMDSVQAITASQPLPIVPSTQASAVAHVDPSKNLVNSISHPPVDSLVDTDDALQTALRALSSRITFLSNSRDGVDPTSISATADAIAKTAHALSEVRKLR